MTEVDWTDEAEAAPAKKKGIPRWIWIGCGCGCLTTIVLLALGAWVLSRSLDPNVQWPKLGQVLPFEDRPTDLELQIGIPIPGIDMFTLHDREDGYQATVTHFGAADEDELDEIFSEDPDALPGGIGKPTGAEAIEIELQGRMVRAVRFDGIRGIGAIDQLGPGIRIDASRKGAGFTMVELRQFGDDPISDEQIADFFDHFQLWGDAPEPISNEETAPAEGATEDE